MEKYMKIYATHSKMRVKILPPLMKELLQLLDARSTSTIKKDNGGHDTLKVDGLSNDRRIYLRAFIEIDWLDLRLNFTVEDVKTLGL